MAGKIKKLLDKIPVLESLRAFLEQWGLWPYIKTGATALAALVIALVAYLETLSLWQSILAAIAALGIVFGTIDFALSAFRKWIDVRTSPKLDRIELADRARRLAQGIMELAGKAQADYMIARQEEMMETTPDRAHASKTAPVRARALERYADKFHAEAWAVITTSAKLTALDRGDVWQIQNILTTGYDFERMGIFLTKLASDLENPMLQDIEMTDKFIARVSSQADEAAVPQLPQGTGPETQQ